MKRVLVVGAGIGGLTLLAALRRIAGEDARWSLELAERRRGAAAAGAGIVLQPNGMRVLARLGLADEVVSAGSVIPTLELRRGEQSRTLRLASVWEGIDQPTVGIARATLHEILARAALEGRAGAAVRVQRGEAVAVEGGASRARVRFADGTTADYDLVVGADGVRSIVRRDADPSAEAVPTGHAYLRFLADNVLALPAGAWRTTELAEGSFGFVALSRALLHGFVELRHRDERNAADRRALVDAASSLDRKLALAFGSRRGRPHAAPAYVVRPVSWGRGAIVLLGDAAHAISPTLTQGGSLAMEDALILAVALRSSHSVDAALERFRIARHERVVWAQRMSILHARGGRSENPAWHIDAAAATAYLRGMYAPLRVDPASLLA